MRKLLLLAVVLFATSSVFAENTGCGFGTMIFEGKSGKVNEILAVTTNGTSASQTFAISSGTAGYKEGATIASNEAKVFVEENMDMLAADISRGDGEYIDALADIMDVEDKDAFNSKLRNNFELVYTHDNVSSEEVVQNIYKVSKS